MGVLASHRGKSKKSQGSLYFLWTRLARGHFLCGAAAPSRFGKTRLNICVFHQCSISGPERRSSSPLYGKSHMYAWVQVGASVTRRYAATFGIACHSALANCMANHACMYECMFVNILGALKGTELRWQREPKTQIFAENRRFSQIRPFSWKFQHLEAAGDRRKPQIFTGNRKRFSQKTAGNRRLGSVTLGPSPLARP